MSFDATPSHTATFRARYRAEITPYYNAWLHGGFVLLFGVLCIGFLWSQTENIQPWEWLAIPLGLIFQNWGEYKVHKNLGHHKHRLSALFYKRHTGDHHSFFAEGHMSYEFMRDWRIIFFPAWLIVIFAIGVFAAWWPLSAVNHNAAALFCGTLLLGYLGYEIIHACEHLPAHHPLATLPWIRQMRELHALHHHHALMHRYNFNIMFPLWDWIYGTLYTLADERADNRANMTVMQHHIDLPGSPAKVLRYLSTPTRWHEWHPYHVAIKGPAGSLPIGSHFDYTGGRAGYLHWEVIDHIPGQRWQAKARGKYGLMMYVTYECTAKDGGTRFTRTLEYKFTNGIGRLADRISVRKRIERDSIALLLKLGCVAERAISA